MGFLDNIIKKSVNKFVDDKLDQVASNVTNKINDKIANKIPGFNTSDSSASNSGFRSSADLSVSERIEKVCEERFPEYTLKENVPAGTFGGSSDSWNISYTLTMNDELKLGIMVLDGKNDYARKAVRLAHEACLNAGANCINIMEYLPSTEEYIAEAISNNIR